MPLHSCQNQMYEISCIFEIIEAWESPQIGEWMDHGEEHGGIRSRETLIVPSESKECRICRWCPEELLAMHKTEHCCKQQFTTYLCAALNHSNWSLHYFLSVNWSTMPRSSKSLQYQIHFWDCQKRLQPMFVSWWILVMVAGTNMSVKVPRFDVHIFVVLFFTQFLAICIRETIRPTDNKITFSMEPEVCALLKEQQNCCCQSLGWHQRAEARGCRAGRTTYGGMIKR